MSNPVVNNAIIECSLASSQPPGTPVPGPLPANSLALPSSQIPNMLTILPTSMVNIGGQPAATIMDNKPGVNIKPFQVSCKSSINPANISASGSATAAAGGLTMTVLTPCVPLIPGPWTPGCATCSIGNFQLLNNSSKLMCAHGGVISIKSTPATTVNVP